ncbi:hypothetical protein MJO29_005390 [Puccinia striiformis f. sp. tritici]|uniref:Integrase core domain-containing protein n=1 Tax=Puccinia striiformis f. sp. tritici PST-78 TaxID=1165861 RepID=A0A0L0V1S5_9BASI|nr:hypothetical protein Pst134EB_010578 [Puccinia striiformis f. sp. tritici]KAI7960322.1 hypothetical protein MJO29_005390 [Puccinia striiformis f. sp. tritici]KNE92949.1 hypothetical protein PSTG_13663 [Puccinia striiformis f. sp. tritici PST-78]
MPSFGDEYKPIVLNLIQSGCNNQQILAFLRDNHSLSVSERTLTRRKADWELNNHARQQTNQLEEDIRRYFCQGLSIGRIHRVLSTRHGYVHCQRTLERKLQEMNLQRRNEDLIGEDDGGEGIGTVIECVRQLHQTPEGRNAGYRKLKHLLQTTYGINIHQGTAAAINRALDPEGVDRRSKRVLKRRVFKVAGPNFIWSADGHDKLLKFGLTLYGFIDAWSRKILGMFVHTTNSNPRHIGYYYLQLVKQAHGIPHVTSTDRGTETIDLAGHQMNLMSQFGNSETPDPDQSHRYSKSTHNQKIECLWSQFMREYNSELINQLYKAQEQGHYDPEEPVQKLLFIYLWVPLLQRGLDKWILDYNTYKRRVDRRSMLPSGCSADNCYERPEDYDAEQGLIPVELSVVNQLENDHYPDADDLMRTCPEWFSEIIEHLKSQLELNTPQVVSTQNVWSVFALLHSAIQVYDACWLQDPTNVKDL